MSSDEWFANGKVDELAFCEEFVEQRRMKCVGGRFYTVDGEIEPNRIKAEIAERLFRGNIKTGVAKKTAALFDALKLFCFSEPFPISPNIIHLQNGTLSVNGDFSHQKEFCVNRLNVNYNPNAKSPNCFIDFLSELLEDEDIFTLQEYLGYCLIPSTKGQTALFLIGNGGEGKSRIGVVLNAIFGNAMITGSFQRVESDRFFRYNLKNKLLMVDDDLQMSALMSTGYVKTIISAETPIDVEQKGQQSEQAQLFSRFVCFGNGSPQALYDKSEGFARRLLILSVKPKSPNRVDDPFIAETFLTEKDEIFFWFFKGLQRLIGNNYRFTVSKKSLENRNLAVDDDCNIAFFLEDETVIIFGNEFAASSKALYSVYSEWAKDNNFTAEKSQNFSAWLRRNQDKYRIKYDTNIEDECRKRKRGFRGIGLLK